MTILVFVFCKFIHNLPWLISSSAKVSSQKRNLTWKIHMCMWYVNKDFRNLLNSDKKSFFYEKILTLKFPAVNWSAKYKSPRTVLSRIHFFSLSWQESWKSPMSKNQVQFKKLDSFKNYNVILYNGLSFWINGWRIVTLRESISNRSARIMRSKSWSQPIGFSSVEVKHLSKSNSPIKLWPKKLDHFINVGLFLDTVLTTTSQ